jgi:16S rRNA (guanine1516-N2)-methyltransferase
LSNLDNGLEIVPRAVCTTPWNVNSKANERMIAFAKWFGCGTVPRNKRSIEQVFTDEGVDIVIVANEDPTLYHKLAPEQPLFFHIGMAGQRIQNMRHGSVDRLVRVAAIQPGDTVVDATMGLGLDTMVLSVAVGEQGRVIAVESSWYLARLFLYGIRHSKALSAALRRAFLNIEVICGHHEDVLRNMESNSVDVVYFDPMFRRPTQKPSSIDAGRAWANPEPLSDAAWIEAQRVARRSVILKERPRSKQFMRFGLEPDKLWMPFAYGVWNKE